MSKVYLKDSLIRPTGRTPGANTLGYYPLETDANDYSGNNRHGTASSVTFTTLSGVKCASFYSTRSQIKCEFNLGLNNNITQSIWFNKSSGGNIYSIASMIGHQSDSSIQLWQRNGITTEADLWDGRSDTTVSDGNNRDGKWHNAISTYNGQTLILYVDGNYVGQKAKQDNIYNDWIGIGNHFRSPSNTFAFGGYLSNAIFENKVRTSDEVLAYYNQTKGLYGIS